jgi:iron(III) transport system ATP-binding protein
VALARARPRPQLLLLTSLSPTSTSSCGERLSIEVRAILKAMGTTALLVTHDQHEAFAMADNVGVMHDGVIEQWDSAYNLYHRPVTRFVADFVGEGVLLQATARCVRPHRHGAGIAAPLPRLRDPPRPADLAAAAAGRRGPRRRERPQGEVVKKTFRGAEFLYTLRLADGNQVLSLVPSHHNHAIGERIGIKLDVDHVVAFPR